MSALDPFRVAEGPFAGAFRMDDKDGADMRKTVGLGDCDCCDYFFPKQGNVILLAEETHLTQTLLRIQKAFAAAPAPVGEENRMKYVNNRIMWENRLKVYGGMLTLQRFAAQSNEVAAMMRGKKFRFRLVDKGTIGQPDEMELHHWRQKLLINFRGIFSRQMIDEVEVIRLANLRRENHQPGYALR